MSCSETARIPVSCRLKSPLFWIRLLLGALFIAASLDKIVHPEPFARLIVNYQILPHALVNVAALTLPWLELTVGLFLVTGLWLPGAVLISNLLLITFYAALLYNTARGLNVHCGCFSTQVEGAPNMAWYLMRDGFFLILGGTLFAATFLRRGSDLLP